MNKIILLVSIFSFVIAKSQTGQNAASVGEFMRPSYLKWNYPWLSNYTGDKKLKEIKFKNLLKDKDGEAFYFNAKGLMAKAVYKQSYRRSPFSTAVGFHEYSYNSNDNLVEAKHLTKKNELKYVQTWTYYSASQLSSTQTKYNGKPSWQIDYSYSDDSCLVKNESFYYKRGEKHSKNFYQYAYDANKKVKTTKFYKKNKLKHTWNYACDERGKILKKDTTTICTAGGIDSKGRKIVTEYSPDIKNNITKTVHYYYRINNRDVLSEYHCFRVLKGKEVMLYSMHEPDSLEPFRSFKTYNKKGNLEQEDVTNYFVFNSSSKILKDKNRNFYNKAGRIYYAIQESFNEKGLPLSSQVIGKNNKVSYKKDYAFNGDSGFTINHYKKSKLKRSYQAEITYY